MFKNRVWFLLAGILIGLLAACTVVPSDPETEFQSETGVKIDPQVVLSTNAKTFDSSSNRGIAHWVPSRDAKTLYFEDESLGLRVYKYAPNTSKWTCLICKSIMVAPQPVIVPPKSSDVFAGTFVINPFEIPAAGTLRLTILGWKDPNNPEASKFVAFKDVEIVRR